MRWLLLFCMILILVGSLHRWLRWLGVGRLPGDIRLRIFRREIHLPLGSSVLLSVAVLLLAHWVGQQR